MGDQEQKTKEARIARLRERLRQIIRTREQDVQLVAIMNGILDLLGDEL